MQRSKIDIWVGLFVLLGAAALLFLALKAANLIHLQTGSSYQITAQFQDVGGLKEQAPVRSSGVLVGRVSNIRYDNKGFRALVTIEMNSDYTFPDDSTLKIFTNGLLGDQYIGVEPGFSESSWQANAEVSNTQSAVVLESLISQFMGSKTLDAAKQKPDPSNNAID